MKNFIKKRLLKEFLTNDGLSLIRYFSMSKEDKLNYLPHDYPYLIGKFIKENNIPIKIEGEAYEFVDELELKHPKIYDEFSIWLYNMIKHHHLGIPDSEYPAWSYYDDKPEIIKNQWLIHFTDIADPIVKDGFKFGVSDANKLGLTTHLDDFEKQYGGYNFAYTLTDYIKYARANSKKFKYGDEAVLFRASGVKLYHYGDEEPQVIFYGNTANNINAIVRGENAEWGIYNKIGNRVLFEDDNFNKVVNWFIKNYDQYRKILN